MENVKKLLNRLGKWEYTGLCLLVLVIVVLHFAVIMQPDETLFDEVHYVKDARLIIGGGGTARPEHPPLAKLIIVAGIELFGDNPFGWRFFPILFSAAGIVFFYLICRRLNLSRRVSYLATFLLALENLSWVQGHVAMLDVFSLTLSLAAFWLYLKNRYVLSGMAVGLSILAKLSGALAIVVIGLHWFLTKGWPEIWKQLRSLPWFLTGRKDRWRSLRQFLTGSREEWRFLLVILAVPITVIALMPLLDCFIWWQQWFGPNPVIHGNYNPIVELRDMMKLTGSITFGSYDPYSIATRPWDWLLPLRYGKWDLAHFVLPYGGALRWQGGLFGPTGVWSYLGMVSPTLTVFIMPLFLYIIWRAIKGETRVLFPFAWFVGTYLVWIPASLITDRASYIFYFYPTIGAVCLGLAIVIFKLLATAQARQRGKLRWFITLVVPLYLLLHLATFVVLVPIPLLWSIPLGLLVYVFTLYYLGIVKRRGPGDGLAPAMIQVAKPPETIVK